MDEAGELNYSAPCELSINMLGHSCWWSELGVCGRSSVVGVARSFGGQGRG